MKYSVLGFLLPSCALVIFKNIKILQLILPVFFLCLGFYEVLENFYFFLILTSLILSLILRHRYQLTVLQWAQVLFISLMSFFLAGKLPWWKDFWNNTITQPLSFYIFSFLFVFNVAFSSEKIKKEPPLWLKRTLIAIGWTVFALASTRIAFDQDTDFFIGTITLLKQGGWLLWDTPSQYGFLNLFLASQVPGKNPIVSLFIMNSLLLFISNIIFFNLFCECFSGLLGLIGGIFATFIFMHVSCGYLPLLIGINPFPSCGAFRFIWCYVLYLIIVKLSDLDLSSESLLRQKRYMIFGLLAWLCGCLWSIESAFFCSLIWGTYF